VTDYLSNAFAELKTKSLRDIQMETARIWCARACAAAQMGMLVDAVEYAHESVEHAALSGDDVLLAHVRETLAAFQVPV